MKLNLPPTEIIEIEKIKIDHLEMSDAILKMLQNQQKAFSAIKKVINEIGKVVEITYEHLCKSKNGRLVYVGAGTSGRIAVQDGAELNPTFSWPYNRLAFVIAGGKEALLKSVENAEDDVEGSNLSIKKLNINDKDVIIALAASGNTPFTCNFVKKAKEKKALTIGISNNANGMLTKYSDLKIVLDTGAEVIAGSTRLKAGTSQKICLNIISTMLMIKFKRVKNGYMSHLKATNKKLRDRQKRIKSILNS